jgi:hypothetical protein
VAVNHDPITDPHGSASVLAFWIHVLFDTVEDPNTVFVIVHFMFLICVVFFQCEYCEHRVANRSNLRFANSFFFLCFFNIVTFEK